MPLAKQVAPQVRWYGGEPRPLVKYPGGKGWIADRLTEPLAAWLRQNSNGRYLEPFCGGAAIGIAMGARTRGTNGVLADLGEMPFVVLGHAKANPGAVHAALRRFAARGTDRAAFERLREEEPKTGPAQAARMILLSRLGFNGLWRTNRQGRYNVPYGRYDRIDLPSLGQLEIVSKTLEGFDIRRGDFEDTARLAGRGDLLVCDPPYVSCFDGYSGPGAWIDGLDRPRLARAAGEALSRGAGVVVFDLRTPWTRKLYRAAGLQPIALSHVHSIGATAERRKSRPETIFAGPAKLVETIRHLEEP